MYRCGQSFQLFQVAKALLLCTIWGAGMLLLHTLSNGLCCTSVENWLVTYYVTVWTRMRCIQSFRKSPVKQQAEHGTEEHLMEHSMIATKSLHLKAVFWTLLLVLS